MTLSNDSEEGVWTLKLLREACEALASNMLEFGKFDSWHVQRVFQTLDDLWKNFDGLGLCFSSKGDMLSQWRGYSRIYSGAFIRNIPVQTKKYRPMFLG
jgi:hypothetical protein